jgi:hypothetical protein
MRSYSDTRVTSRIVDARICISTTNIHVDSKQKTYVLSSSVADPWHFGVDPDPDPDPRIHASD